MSSPKKQIEEKLKRDPIKEIRVLGLFGVFDHQIPISENSHVTVIHGPNGVGKTIVLRMIQELLSGVQDVFKRIPFEQFHIGFESGDEIVLRRQLTSSLENPSKELEIVYYAMLNGKTFEGEYIAGLSENKARQLARMLGESWAYRGDECWIDRRDGETLDFDEAIARLPSKFQIEFRRSEDPVLEEIKAKCNVRLIGTDRLTNQRLSGKSVERQFRSEYGSMDQKVLSFQSLNDRSSGFDDLTIARYSKDLTFRLSESLRAYGRLTENLDRSLVKRLLAKNFEPNSAEEVLMQFRKLDEKRRELTNLGLLNETEDVLGRDGDQDVLQLISESLNVFSIYVQDMQSKLALFDDLRNKVSVLLERTRARFQFKKLLIDPKEGLVFLSETGARLDVSDLSSGEQHEMILFYDLLFFASEEDLILIDEPEISLHIEWQMEFLDDLRTALKSSNTHVLIATHSPAIARAARHALVSLGQ